MEFIKANRCMETNRIQKPKEKVLIEESDSKIGKSHICQNLAFIGKHVQLTQQAILGYLSFYLNKAQVCLS